MLCGIEDTTVEVIQPSALPGWEIVHAVNEKEIFKALVYFRGCLMSQVRSVITG